eukprot:scaffold269526_cov30-Tisochrysis_lutea.AAC.3
MSAKPAVRPQQQAHDIGSGQSHRLPPIQSDARLHGPSCRVRAIKPPALLGRLSAVGDDLSSWRPSRRVAHRLARAARLGRFTVTRASCHICTHFGGTRNEHALTIRGRARLRSGVARPRKRGGLRTA